MATINAILAFLFGQKYYINIFCDRGIDNAWVSSQIFLSKAEAEAHRRRNECNHSFTFMQTRSFRSRIEYNSMLDKINNNNPVCGDGIAT